MRNSFVSLAIGLSASIAMLSCGKEAPPPPAASAETRVTSFTEGIVVQHGLLKFETIDVYRSWVDEPGEAKRDAFVAGARTLSDFTSAQELGGTNSGNSADLALASMIDDPYFKEMLNKDLAIWIADWVFRINPAEGKVFVIKAEDITDHYQALLNQDLSDRAVQAYSADEEVLELLMAEQTGGSRCTAQFAGAHHTPNYFLTDNTGRYGHSHYAQYGVYFTLFTRIDPIGSSSPVYDFDYMGSMWDGAPHIFYKVRCGGSADYSTISSGTWTGGGFRYQSYQGGSALEKVYFYVKIKDRNSPYSHLTPQFGFRKNI